MCQCNKQYMRLDIWPSYMVFTEAIVSICEIPSMPLSMDKVLQYYVKLLTAAYIYTRVIIFVAVTYLYSAAFHMKFIAMHLWIIFIQ